MPLTNQSCPTPRAPPLVVTLGQKLTAGFGVGDLGMPNGALGGTVPTASMRSTPPIPADLADMRQTRDVDLADQNPHLFCLLLEGVAVFQGAVRWRGGASSLVHRLPCFRWIMESNPSP